MDKKNIISTAKIEIYISESDSIKRKENYKMLRDFSYHSRNMANYMMTTYNTEFYLKRLSKENPQADVKLISQCFSSSKGETKGQAIAHRSLGYKITTDKYAPLLPSTIRTSISQKVNKDFGNTIKDVLSGKRSSNSYRSNMPILFLKTAIAKFSKADDKNFTFNLFGIKFNTRLGRDKSNNEAILQNILENKYQLCDSSLQFDETKLFLYVVFKHDFESKASQLDANKVLGVDLGIKFPAYVSIFGDKPKQAIGNKEDFLNQRLKIYSQRKRLQKNLQQTAGGHGRRDKLKKLEDFSQKEKNFVQTYNHTISKQIVEFAIKHGCGTINIENLQGISNEIKNKFILRNWSYYQLVSMIKYKADKHGIKVNEINPAYTSQRCSQCGHIHADNRITQDAFICVKCAFTENADYNASQNISIAHTPEFIKQIESYKNFLRGNNDVFNPSEVFDEKEVTTKVVGKIKKKKLA